LHGFPPVPVRAAFAARPVNNPSGRMLSASILSVLRPFGNLFWGGRVLFYVVCIAIFRSSIMRGFCRFSAIFVRDLFVQIYSLLFYARQITSDRLFFGFFLQTLYGCSIVRATERNFSRNAFSRRSHYGNEEDVFSVYRRLRNGFAIFRLPRWNFPTQF
jgi:hypothetical protein